MSGQSPTAKEQSNGARELTRLVSRYWDRQGYTTRRTTVGDHVYVVGRNGAGDSLLVWPAGDAPTPRAVKRFFTVHSDRDFDATYIVSDGFDGDDIRAARELGVDVVEASSLRDSLATADTADAGDDADGGDATNEASNAFTRLLTSVARPLRDAVRWSGTAVRDAPVLVATMFVLGVVNAATALDVRLALASFGPVALLVGYVTLLSGYRTSLADASPLVDRTRIVDFGRFVGVALGYVAVSLLGTVLLVVPGLVLAARFSFALPAAVTGERTLPDCFRESWRLTSDVATGGALAVVVVSYLLAVSLGVVPDLLLDDALLASLATFPLFVAVNPLFGLVLWRLYDGQRAA